MTERICHDLVQGTPEWDLFRLEHFGASEASAMLNLSSNVKRNELLHMKHTCMPKEFSAFVQERILDKGHEVEALARPIVEEELGKELYPMVFSFGRLSASCDGLTLMEDTAWENKQYNKALYESIGNGVLPEEHMPQPQQVLLVTGAERLIFTCSDGTEEGTVWMEVLPDQEWFDRLHAGWDQFGKDLAAYVPRELPEKPQAEAIMGLPALVVQIRGEVVTSNLSAYRSAAERFIDSIKTDPDTDEDFAQAEATIKFCDEAERKLVAALDGALAQMSTVDEAKRTIEYLRDRLRTTRLTLTKTVTKRKEDIKTEIVADGRKRFAEHLATLNAELSMVTLQIMPPDFVAAAKNKRTLASLHDAVDSAVAAGKIAADAAAREMRSKLDWYRPKDESHGFLFRDLQTLIQKPVDDFKLVVTSRIDAHVKAEDERKAREAAAIEAAKAAEAAKLATAGNVVASAEAPSGTTASMATGRAATPVATPSGTGGTSGRARAKTAPTLRLGQINERLAPISLSADGLAQLGFAAAATEKNAKLFHEDDFPKICAALIRHIESVKAEAF